MFRVLLTVDPEIPVPPPLYGGIERIVDGLTRELRSRGCAVGLIAHPSSTSEVEFFRAWPGASSLSRVDTVKNTLALARGVSAFRPDIVHSFSRLVYLLPLMRRRLAKIMSYQRFTGGARNRIAAQLGGNTFAYTACSEYIARMGRTWGGTWIPIHNFVDVDFYRCVAEVPADAPLVFLSRIESIKGAHSAIQIAQRSGRRLVIAGNRVENAEGQRYWAEEIEPHLVPGRVDYVGAVDDHQKNALLGAAAAMVVPIEWDEPFGIVFAEALACGTPVISCPRGALPEIIGHGVHGFLVSSVDEGVRAVAALPTIDRLGCRRLAERRFSRQAATDAYVDLYERLIHAAAR